ncbi:MAG: glycosyltransferase [Paludibacteraceae bacterium]|nr:glycosyltransferase [Paludibacteraceae bacterium]
MSKGKVLHISKFYPPYKGGIEDVCYSIVSSMADYEHRVLCFNTGKNTVDEQYEGVSVLRLGVQMQRYSQPISFSYPSALKRELQEFNPDIIHLHTPNPYASLLVCHYIPDSVKLIVHWHSDIVKQQFTYTAFKPFEQKLLERANAIFATSPNYAEHSIPLRQFRDKVIIVPNGINEKKISVREGDDEKIEAIKRKYNGRNIVYFMGRHVAYKGIDRLIAAEKKITSDCVILIAGEGPLSNELKMKTQSERVHFIGKISDDEIRLYMRAASVFAFPSITKNEAFGIVLAEAMYCGTPPVLFSIEGSGVNWLNQNGTTGIEVDNGDIQAFAEAIDRLLRNEDHIRDRMGERAHDLIAENFTMTRIKDVIAKEYDTLIHQRS